MSFINLQNIRLAENIQEDLNPIRNLIESKINLKRYSEGHKPLILNQSKLHRICLLAGLSSNELRSRKDFENIQIGANRIFETLFTHHNLLNPILALLKLRYKNVVVDWNTDREASKVINGEIRRGADLLLKDEVLEEWLMFANESIGSGRKGSIP